MICWDRVGDELVVGVFEPEEIAALRDYATLFKRLVEWRLATHEPVEVLGVRLGLSLPPAVVEDERLLAVLHRHLGADADDHELLWWEPECLRTLADHLDVLQATLPPAGGVIVLLDDAAQAVAWIKAGRDITAAMAVVRDAGEPEVAERTAVTIAWLTELLDRLHDHATRDSDTSVIPW
ncbi:hypothetical protein ACIGNX_01655 [Actinosynnema sp. NPDC053489]|uniref:hypothetical protein n=1 Tax=Actinosynnema sp. NPDC053489 TaxID=3363916 RepID=UPI0037CCB6F8